MWIGKIFLRSPNQSQDTTKTPPEKPSTPRIKVLSDKEMEKLCWENIKRYIQNKEYKKV